MLLAIGCYPPPRKPHRAQRGNHQPETSRAETSGAQHPAPTRGRVHAKSHSLIQRQRSGDEKTGITRYVNAVKSVQGEFQAREQNWLNLQQPE